MYIRENKNVLCKADLTDKSSKLPIKTGPSSQKGSRSRWGSGCYNLVIMFFTRLGLELGWAEYIFVKVVVC
jgi:hypothetical protein